VDHLPDDLTPEELASLKLLVTHGRLPGRGVTSDLTARGLVAESADGLALTPDGRRALVRGSPALWSLVA
jgi:hypothetical protein